MQIHRANETVVLGPLGSAMADGSAWLGRDEFPSSQSWADEVERVLAFADSRVGLDRCLGDLRGSLSQRDSALAELRVAFFFDRNGFRLTAWKPRGAGLKEGEFCIRCPSREEVFVEVKSPGWESELTQAERLAGRTELPKYQTGEGRWYNPAEPVRFAVRKAYPKFADARKNLLVVADDLFVGLEHGTDSSAQRALYAHSADPEARGYFADSAYERLGGVGIFWILATEDPIGYDMKLFVNSHATSCALPAPFVFAFHGLAG